MKRCVKCQHELADNAKFCTFCGTRQPDVNTPPQGAPSAPAASVANEAPVAPAVQPAPAPKAAPAVDPAVLLAEAVGKHDVIEEVQRLVAFYTASKREGRLRQRPEMDMLVLGNSGTGKTFLISLIHQLFLANGIITHPRIKKVDASAYNQWIGTLNEKTIEELRGRLVVIDNAHLLMTDTEHLTPIDRLLSMMEDWERDLSADWHTYPIAPRLLSSRAARHLQARARPPRTGLRGRGRAEAPRLFPLLGQAP